MTTEQLLAPRYEVIADYPESPYKIGQIEFADTWTDDPHDGLHKYPAIFKPLQWHEKRLPKDMPEYIKTISKGEIVRVAGWNFNVFWTCQASDSSHCWMQDEIIPASQQEYDQYIKSTTK
jgi:hypothetical protein